MAIKKQPAKASKKRAGTSSTKTQETKYVLLTNEQIEQILHPTSERIVVASAGPINFDVSLMDMINKRVKVTVWLLSLKVSEVILDQDCLNVTIGPDIWMVKATITLSLNWDKKVVLYNAKACARKSPFSRWQCSNYSGSIGDW